MVQERPVRVERRLSAILAADVAGYSRLMHHDEEATHAKLTALLVGAVEPAIAEHGGRIVKNTGDGFLAEFPSAVEAVRAAIQFQTRIHELTISEVEDRRVAFRVGVNIGDVIVEAHDIFGDGINVAARLEGIAEPGGICISASAYDQVRGKVGVEFVDLGEQNLKNIDRPVRAYAALQDGPPATALGASGRDVIKTVPRRGYLTATASVAAVAPHDPVLPDWSLWVPSAGSRLDLLRFVRAHRLAVVATNSPDGQPQTSVVRFVVTDAFELIVDAHGTARKVGNLGNSPKVGVTIGWDDLQTLQIDGMGEIQRGDDLERAKQFYASQFPERYRARQGIEDLVFIRITPRWMRFSDFRRNPADVFTLDPATGRQEHSINLWRVEPA
jgi:class 3 adenylate cyclase